MGPATTGQAIHRNNDFITETESAQPNVPVPDTRRLDTNGWRIDHPLARSNTSVRGIGWRGYQEDNRRQTMEKVETVPPDTGVRRNESAPVDMDAPKNETVLCHDLEGTDEHVAGRSRVHDLGQ